MPPLDHQPSSIPSSGLVAEAISLTPVERRLAVEAFFGANDGTGCGAPGLGRAILDFQDWEVRSGRVSGEGGGSPWWSAVNGMMALDLAAAVAGAPGTPAVRAWQAYAWGAAQAPGSDCAQALLWHAHQLSLHAGIRAAEHLLRREPAAERAFAAIVIDVVDRTALAHRPTDSGELAGLVERFYPKQYPICDSALPPLERMRARTASALSDRDGSEFADVGLGSSRWG